MDAGRSLFHEPLYTRPASPPDVLGAMSLRVAFTLLVCLSLAGPAVAGAYQPPRTSTGAPELQGVWTNLSLTPLERSSNFKGLVATDAELAAMLARRKVRENAKVQAASTAPTPPAAANSDDVGQEETEFADRNDTLMRIEGQFRTSIIVDPADGRMPYTPLGEKLAAGAAHDRFDNPEDRPLAERCIEAPNGMSGPPMLSGPDNANIEIVQTPTDIAILTEQIHDVRIVHMNARHAPGALHPWMGDSIGWWDGDTLVIETVNQNPQSAPRSVGARVFWLSADAKVTERLTRISPTQILYAFTIEDPAIYTRPWRGEMVLNAAKGPIYEYACHEGNYALRNILSGARKQERDAEATGAARS